MPFFFLSACWNTTLRAENCQWWWRTSDFQMGSSCCLMRSQCWSLRPPWPASAGDHIVWLFHFPSSLDLSILCSQMVQKPLTCGCVLCFIYLLLKWTKIDNQHPKPVKVLTIRSLVAIFNAGSYSVVQLLLWPMSLPPGGRLHYFLAEVVPAVPRFNRILLCQSPRCGSEQRRDGELHRQPAWVPR